ncbi:MAG: hypothetical protein KAW12_21490 [Candidatus Aminicenantes bacterium]|nr:hypothetical protein [Candidatus Aminicenantes bacterium]
MTFVEVLKDKAPEVTFHTRDNIIEREIVSISIWTLGFLICLEFVFVICDFSIVFDILF